VITDSSESLDINSLYSQAHDYCGRLQNLLDKVATNKDIRKQSGDALKNRRADYDENLSRLRRGLSSPTFKIAIAGGFSGGKSSLLNAIFGRPIMAVGVSPETANVAVLRRASGPDDERVIVKYLSQEQYFECVRAFCDQLGIPATDDIHELLNESKKLYESLDTSSEKDQTVREELDDFCDLLDGYLKHSNLLGSISESHVVNEQAVHELTSKRDGRATGSLALVREVEIRVTTDVLSDHAMVIDLPGTDSTRPRDTRIARDYLSQVDAVIVTTLFKRPLAKADSQMIQLLNAYRTQLIDKLFFVITQFDLAIPEEKNDLVRPYRHILSQIEKYFRISKPRFMYLTSAYISELVERKRRDTRLDEAQIDQLDRFLKEAEAYRRDANGKYSESPQIRELLDEYYVDGGIGHLRNELLKFFENECLRVKLRDACERISELGNKVGTVFVPIYNSAVSQEKDIMMKVGMQACHVADKAKRVLQEIQQHLLWESLSDEFCIKRFTDVVTRRMPEVLGEAIDGLNLVRELQSNLADGRQAIARKCWELAKEKYLELIHTYLDEDVFGPIDRECASRGLDQTVSQLFQVDSAAYRRYETLREEYRRHTKICFEARAVEQMRNFAKKVPILGGDLALTGAEANYKQDLKKFFEGSYNSQVSPALKGVCRFYVEYCLDIYFRGLASFLDPQAHVDCLNIPGLAGNLDMYDLKTLETYNTELQEVKTGIERIEARL